MRLLAHTAKMSKEEIFSPKFRAHAVGGSEAATVVNKNPYQTLYGLYLEKRGEIPPFEGNERTKWGNKMEPLIAEEFKEKNPGIWVQKKNFILQHDTHDFMICQIDRELFCKERGRGVLEIKNNGYWAGQEWSAEEGAPAQYILQMQHMLAVTNYEWGRFAALVDGGEYREIEILPDKIIQEILIEAEAKFIENVKNGIEPELSGSKYEDELLKQLYPEAKYTEPKPLESKAGELAKKRAEMKKRLEQDEIELKQVEHELKKMLGEHEAGIIDNTQIFWKNVLSNRVDSKKLKAEYPDIYAAVVKQSQSRRFEIKEAK